MTIRILTLSLLMCITVFSSIESSPLLDEKLMANNPSLNVDDSALPMLQHANLIAFLCQQHKQIPLELKRKFCSNYIRLHKIQDDDEGEQQRNKRVGWTISV